MTAPLRFLFDECVGKPVMEQIANSLAFSTDEFQFAHILDFQKQGIHDEKWIPEKAREGNWIIVTGDRGKQGKASKGEKLPVVCKNQGVTHVVLSAAIHQKTSREKIVAILSVWPELKKLGESPKGSQHLLRYKGSTPILVQIDPPPQSPNPQPLSALPPQQTASQGILFPTDSPESGKSL